LDLRRIIAEFKIRRAKRKTLVDSYKLEETLKTVPLALKTLVDIMRTGKEHNRLSAAQTLLRPTMAYLEKHGASIAESELMETENGLQMVLNVNKIPRSN
jgi:hypothetical protein